jgi:formylglycine-generating enzyme required for sulfatase activity
VKAAAQRRRTACVVLATAALVGCGRTENPAGAGDAATDAAPPWDVVQPEQQPRPGMVWVPPGVLIAGTPPDKLPRVADEEMAGEQVVMRGFYIDVFSHPNEAGAIPTTGMTQDEARAVCEEQGKRLCTELEIERACKGPENTTYEYGETYRASVCETGTSRALVPNGYNARCVSGFGVHDLHGGPWTWTSSVWGRGGDKPGHVVLRGGNGLAGERIGRCANARSAKPDTHLKEIGVRCCAGEPNSFEVVLQVVRGDPLRFAHPDDKMRRMLEAALPEEVAARSSARAEDAFVIERTWTWRPIGNEELVLGGGCGRSPETHRAACGIVVARVRSDAATRLAFVSTDRWQPTVGEHDAARILFFYGGDEMGAFRKRITYDWGRVVEGPKERKRRIKGKKGWYYEY